MTLRLTRYLAAHLRRTTGALGVFFDDRDQPAVEASQPRREADVLKALWLLLYPVNWSLLLGLLFVCLLTGESSRHMLRASGSCTSGMLPKFFQTQCQPRENEKRQKKSCAEKFY